MKNLIFGLIILFAMTEAAIADEFTLVCRTKKEQTREAGPASDRWKVSYPTITLKFNTDGNFAAVETDDRVGLRPIESMYDVVFKRDQIVSKPDATKCSIGGSSEDCSGFEINRTTGDFLFISRMLNLTAYIKITGQCKKAENLF